MTIVQERVKQEVDVLTDEQVARYYVDGYIVVRGLVPRDSIERVLQAAQRVSVSDDAKGWQPAVFDHANPQKDADIHALLTQPNIVTAAEQIFEAPARVYYGMLAIVPAHGGNGLPWHQDNQYTQALGRALNVFIALCEITPDKAILWVAPGSHRFGVQPSKQNNSTAPGHREAVTEPEGGMPLPTMQPGDVCIFDRNTYHRSLTNETDSHRYAYAAQYVEEKTRWATTGERDLTRMLATDLDKTWQS